MELLFFWAIISPIAIYLLGQRRLQLRRALFRVSQLLEHAEFGDPKPERVKEAYRVAAAMLFTRCDPSYAKY
jgi:hypothetical protein